MRYQEYRIIRCGTLDDLEIAVNAMLLEHWQPIGGAFIIDGMNDWACQAMGKVEWL